MTTIDQLPARIRAKISIELSPVAGLDGFCWTFTGRLQNHGYGDVTFGSGKQNRWLLHRWTYTQFIGPMPAHLQIDHLCRNRACCNPAHLEAVTGKVNQERGMKRLATHCKRGHKLSGNNLYIKNADSRRRWPSRECRACHREASKRSCARLRARGLPDGHRFHGTVRGYQVYGCKCDPCRAAGAAAWQRNPSSSAGKERRAEAERALAAAS